MAAADWVESGISSSSSPVAIRNDLDGVADHVGRALLALRPLRQ
jgi:hypothetical protein